MFPKSRRGGTRPGSGEVRRTEPTVRIRLRKSEHERWGGLKLRRGLRTDNDVARYLLDLAGINWSVRTQRVTTSGSPAGYIHSTTVLCDKYSLPIVRIKCKERAWNQPTGVCVGK